VHRRNHEALVHEAEAVVELDRIQGRDIVESIDILNLKQPVKHGDSLLPLYAHFLQKILLYFLIRAVLVQAHVRGLLHYLGILTKSYSIHVDIVPQRLLGILPSSLQPKLHSTKKRSVRSQLFANLLVHILLGLLFVRIIVVAADDLLLLI